MDPFILVVVLRRVSGRKQDPLNSLTVFEILGVSDLDECLKVLVIKEKHVCLINDHTLESRKIDRFSTTDKLLNLTMSTDDNLARLRALSEVGDCDACALGDLAVDCCDLITQLTRVHHAQDLSFRVVAVNTQG